MFKYPSPMYLAVDIKTNLTDQFTTCTQLIMRWTAQAVRSVVSTNNTGWKKNKSSRSAFGCGEETKLHIAKK